MPRQTRYQSTPLTTVWRVKQCRHGGQEVGSRWRGFSEKVAGSGDDLTVLRVRVSLLRNQLCLDSGNFGGGGVGQDYSSSVTWSVPRAQD